MVLLVPMVHTKLLPAAHEAEIGYDRLLIHHRNQMKMMTLIDRAVGNVVVPVVKVLLLLALKPLHHLEVGPNDVRLTETVLLRRDHEHNHVTGFKVWTFCQPLHPGKTTKVKTMKY